MHVFHVRIKDRLPGVHTLASIFVGEQEGQLVFTGQLLMKPEEARELKMRLEGAGGPPEPDHLPEGARRP